MRDGLPNVRALEQALADLEGADDAVAVSSGMAAITLTLLAVLRAGDHVVAVEDSYCETGAFLTDEAPRFGVDTTLVASAAPEAILAAVQPATRMIVVETISNPSLRLADVAALAKGAQHHGVLLCVDNTLATPICCRPLALGADLVWHSATKFIGGHHDLCAGVMAGRADLIAGIRQYGQRYGMTLGAMDAWLALRGLHTLAPRMAWICESAVAVALSLSTHPAIAAVQYPGLQEHPDAGLAQRLLPGGAGGILTCSLRGGPQAAEAMIRALRLIAYALSFGGTTTTVCYPPPVRVTIARIRPAATPRARRSGSRSGWRLHTISLWISIKPSWHRPNVAHAAKDTRRGPLARDTAWTQRYEKLAPAVLFPT